MEEGNGQRIAPIIDASITPFLQISALFELAALKDEKIIIINKASASPLKCVPPSPPRVETKSLNLS